MSWSVWLSVREYVYVCARACVCVCVRANVFHQIRTETRCCLQDRNISSVAGAGDAEALTLPLPNPEHARIRPTLINVVRKSGVISLRSLFVARGMKAVFVAHQKQTDFLVAARLVDKDCSFFVTARFLLGVVSSLVVLI